MNPNEIRWHLVADLDLLRYLESDQPETVEAAQAEYDRRHPGKARRPDRDEPRAQTDDSPTWF